ncbi:BOW99_gp33 family protein [Periweissella cryptocerci]|uniref:BOW99_gp33 family protein n=1 Tax=Periweissella cryptocerci TaxID=2506420 RepID=UPI0014043471|nr:hypothetical protein [Periweissella cryptocerci]
MPNVIQFQKNSLNLKVRHIMSDGHERKSVKGLVIPKEATDFYNFFESLQHENQEAS